MMQAISVCGLQRVRGEKDSVEMQAKNIQRNRNRFQTMWENVTYWIMDNDTGLSKGFESMSINLLWDPNSLWQCSLCFKCKAIPQIATVFRNVLLACVCQPIIRPKRYSVQGQCRSTFSFSCIISQRHLCVISFKWIQYLLLVEHDLDYSSWGRESMSCCAHEGKTSKY